MSLIWLTEHNSAVEANTSSEARTPSEVKISLSFRRWSVIVITRGIVLQYSIFLFVLFPAVFLLLLEVRAFEADRFDRLNFSPIEVWREVPALAIVVSCLTVSWHSAATNVYAQSLVFCIMMLCGAIGGGNGWIAGMADRILAHSGKGYQEFGL